MCPHVMLFGSLTSYCYGLILILLWAETKPSEIKLQPLRRFLFVLVGSL